MSSPNRRSRWIAFVAVVSVCSCACAQQNPNGQLPVTSADRPFLFLIRDPVVHDDLKLDARQRLAVRDLNEEWDGAIWSMRNKGAEHIARTTEAAIAAARKKLESLLTVKQQNRMRQIEWWTLGSRAFLRDDLPAALKLSAGEISEIRAAVTETQKAVNELRQRQRSGEPQGTLNKQWQSLKEDERKKLGALLTRPQQRHWMALLGEPIEVSRLGRVKFKAPELKGQGGWLNSPPLSLRQLKGKVVALHFYAFA